jgi:hypothetical protein
MAGHPFTIIPALSAIAVAYTQGNLIADQVMPRVPSSTETFRYLKFNQGDAFTSPDTRVGRKSAPNQIDWNAAELSAATVDQALDTPVPNADIYAFEQALAAGAGYTSPAVDPLARATKLVTQAVQNRREYRVANTIFNTGNYASDKQATLSGTSQWSDYANSDPLGYLMGVFDGMLMRPNIGVLGRQVATKLQMHPKVIKAVFGQPIEVGVSPAGVAPLGAIAKLLGLDDIYVGDAWLNTSAPGQAAAMSRAWGKHASFLYRNAEANQQFGVSFGYTVQYGDKVAGTVLDGDIGMRGGVRVRSGESVIELVTANDLGYFVQNAIA